MTIRDFDLKKKPTNKFICDAPPQCKGRNKILPDGNCELCGDYLVVDDSKLKCVFPKCKFNERVLKDGTCSRCPQVFQR